MKRFILVTKPDKRLVGYTRDLAIWLLQASQEHIVLVPSCLE